MGCNSSKKKREKEEKERKKREKEERKAFVARTQTAASKKPPESSSSSSSSTSVNKVEPTPTVRKGTSKKLPNPSAVSASANASAKKHDSQHQVETGDSKDSTVFGVGDMTSSTNKELTAEQMEKFKAKMANMPSGEKLKSVLRSTKSVRPSDGQTSSIIEYFPSEDNDNSIASGHSQHDRHANSSDSKCPDGCTSVQGPDSQSSSNSKSYISKDSEDNKGWSKNKSVTLESGENVKSVVSALGFEDESVQGPDGHGSKSGKRLHAQLPPRPLTTEQIIVADCLKDYQKEVSVKVADTKNGHPPKSTVKEVAHGQQQPDMAPEAVAANKGTTGHESHKAKPANSQPPPPDPQGDNIPGPQ